MPSTVKQNGPCPLVWSSLLSTLLTQAVRTINVCTLKLLYRYKEAYKSISQPQVPNIFVFELLIVTYA